MIYNDQSGPQGTNILSHLFKYQLVLAIILTVLSLLMHMRLPREELKAGYCKRSVSVVFGQFRDSCMYVFILCTVILFIL